MADAATSRGARIFGFIGRGARYATELTGRVPVGSPATKMSALTGLAEGIVVHRGSPWQGIQGAVLGFLSTWTGELLQDWAENDERGRRIAGPVVHGVTAVGKTLFGLEDTPAMACLVGCVYGAVIGLFSRKERAFKVVSNALEHGFRRMTAAWASQRVLNVAADVGKGKEIVTDLRKWTPAHPVNVKLDVARAHPEVVVEDDLERALLTPTELRQISNAERDVKAAIQRLGDETGIRLDPSRYHPLYVTSPRAKYNPLNGKGIGIKHSIDLPDKSHLRMNRDWFRQGVSRRELRIALAIERVRSDFSSTRIVSEGDTLYTIGGYRKKAVQWPKLEDKKAEAAREREMRKAERPVRLFDEAANVLIGHHMLGYQVVPSKGNEVAVRLQSLYHHCGTDGPAFLAALLRGKLENSFQPLCEFLAEPNVPPPGTDERAALEKAIVEVDLGALRRFRTVTPRDGG